MLAALQNRPFFFFFFCSRQNELALCGQCGLVSMTCEDRFLTAYFWSEDVMGCEKKFARGESGLDVKAKVFLR